MDPITTVVVGTETYDVVHVFNPSRVLINYEGLYCFSDQAIDGSWALSETPAANPDEHQVLKTYTAPMEGKTTVEMLPPDES